MPATPKKGRAFGGSAKHQRQIMANLVASLVASPVVAAVVSVVLASGSPQAATARSASQRAVVRSPRPMRA